MAKHGSTPLEPPKFESLKPPTKKTPTAGNTTRQLYGKYRQVEPLPPGYHVNDYAVTGELTDLPNWDKLSRAERNLTNFLPGISETALPKGLRAPLFPGTYLAGGQIPTVGAALEKFGEGWLGKLLSFIDVPAEGLERGLGYASQAALAIGTPETWKDFTDNSKAAWFAGSLTADVTNMPMWDHENKTWFFPGNAGDLPGADGLVQARRDIADLMQGGMQPGDALVTVRDQYYESLGALQLRAQINDAIVHMAADPLIIMPFLKPIEAAKKGLVIAAGNKIADASMFAKYVDESADLQNFVRIEKVILQEAEAAGDTTRAARAIDDIARTQKELDNVQGFLNRADDLDLGPLEEKFVRVMGMDREAGPTGIARIRLNPFALTPGSRAFDYASTLIDNINNRLLSALNHPADITRSVERTAAGLFTPELGHHILTVEGRMVRANIVPIAGQAKIRLREFDLLAEFETPLLTRLAEEFGEHPVKLLERIKDGDDVIAADRLSNLIRGLDDTDPLIQAFVRKSIPLDEQGIASAVERLKAMDDFPLISADAYKSVLANDIMDIVAHNAQIKFGLKSRGPLQSLADAVKAAETLAFLKLNPTYPIRNALNNFLTSISRGVFGDIRPGYYENIFKTRNIIEPSRFRAGVGFKGLGGDEKGLAEALANFNKLIREVETGKRGALDRITNFLNKKKGLYMGEIAQNLESRSSVRAYGSMWTNYMQQGWKPGVGYQAVEEFSPELARALGPEKSRQVEKLLQSSWSATDMDKAVLAENANATVSNIMDTARQQSGLGQDLENILGPGWTQQFGEQLQQAILKGPSEVKRETNRIWQFIQKHINEQSAIVNDTILEQAAARINTEGMGGFPYVLSDSMSDLWGAQQRHATNMAKISDWVQGLDEPLTRAKFWETIFRDNQAFYKRHWDRIESRFSGSTRGLDDAMNTMRSSGRLTPGLESSLKSMQGELAQTGKNWRKNWEGFFGRRDELYKELQGLRKSERAKKYTAIQDELDALYDKAILREDELMLQLDNLAAGGISDEAERLMFLAHRNRVADTRSALRQSVLDFRRDIQGIPPYERGALWRDEFWPRYQRDSALLEQQEKAIKIAMEGDPGAQLFMGKTLDDAKTALAKFDEVENPITRRLLTNLETEVDAIEVKIVDSIRSSETGMAEIFIFSRDPDTGKVPLEISRFFLKQPVEVQQRTLVHEVSHLLESMGYKDDITKVFGETDPIERMAEIFSDVARGADSPIATPEQATWVRRIIGEEPELKQAVDALARPGVLDEVDEAERLASFPGLLDFHEQAGVSRELIMGQGVDELWFTRGQQAIDAIEASALKIANEPALALDIPDGARNLLNGYINSTKSQLGEQLNLASKMGEWGRDSALLNYNRRMNYNSWLSLIAPYEFWMTQSVYRWALHSIDRPQMLATFLRMRKFMETAYRPEQGLPQRLKGRIRIPIPFMEEWLGKEVFIDPLQAALPIDQFGYGIENYQQQSSADQGRAERVLEELLNDGKITRQDYARALLEKSGPAWDRALALAQQDDAEGRNDAFDFVNMFISTHAPIQWAYNVARGTPERIQPFLPITRSIRAVTAALGIAPNTGGYNPEGMIREAIGLPRFDRWDEYRVDRMIANMVALGEFGVDEGLRAMINQEGDMYMEAVRRAGIEYAGGGIIGAMGRVLGMPARAYPPGEEHLRELKDNYEFAWAHYEKTGDNSKLNSFQDVHPEYELRLALWRPPEKRLRQFLEDEIWNAYNDMTKLHKDELKEHLGDLWQDAMLNKDTRSVANIPTETLQAWLKIMGGDPPGKVTFNENVTPLDFAPEDDAYRVQTFYDTRDRMFDYNNTIWPLTQDYFKLEKGSARRAFVQRHPLLGQYWDWRRDFMERNPDIAKYMEDDPDRRPKYNSEQALQQAQAAQPNFTWLEWRNTLTPPVWRLARDHLRYGDTLTEDETNELEDVARGFGVGLDELVERLRGAYEEAEGPSVNGTSAGGGTEPQEANIVAFLQEGKATHPDEIGPQQEYDQMLRAVRTGEGVSQAIQIADSHMVAHRRGADPNHPENINPPTQTGTIPYAGQPELNQQVADGFARVIAYLKSIK